MTVQDGPIAAFADEEAWRARERYPTIVGMGLPVFVAAREARRAAREREREAKKSANIHNGSHKGADRAKPQQPGSDGR